MNSLRSHIAALLIAFFGLRAQTARAQDTDPFTDEATATARPAIRPDISAIEFACKKQAYFTHNADPLKTCQGLDVGQWDAEAQALLQSVGEYLGAASEKSVGGCEPKSPTSFPLEQAAVARAQADLEKTQQALAGQDAGTPDTRAEEAVTSAQATLDAKKSALKKAALDAARQKQLAWRDAVTKRRAVHDVDTFEQIARGAVALSASSDAGAPPAGAGLTAEQTRASACVDAYKERISVLGSVAAKADERAIDATAKRTHIVDILRKASSSATVATTTSGSIESPGAPDYVVYSVLSALGADEQTTGTQLALTLNLSSLIWPDAKERLKQSVGYRNIFLRGTFPLDVTKTDASGAEAAPAATASQATVRRFSLVLGGSLLDENDTRTDGNRRCYEAALGYDDFGLSAETDLSAQVERQAYFDVCNRVIVNRARVAWRAGVGFVSNAGAAESEATTPEMYAGVFIWAPTSQIYTNLIYQRFLKPRPVHTGGLGVSVAGNAGGGPSGADAWARVGIDSTFLLVRDPDAKQTSWQLRFAPTLRGRLFGDSVASIALGPIIQSKGDAALLATVTFGYDADRIMNELLTPLPPPSGNPAQP